MDIYQFRWFRWPTIYLYFFSWLCLSATVQLLNLPRGSKFICSKIPISPTTLDFPAYLLQADVRHSNSHSLKLNLVHLQSTSVEQSLARFQVHHPNQYYFPPNYLANYHYHTYNNYPAAPQDDYPS